MRKMKSANSPSSPFKPGCLIQHHTHKDVVILMADPTIAFVLKTGNAFVEDTVIDIDITDGNWEWYADIVEVGND